MSVSFIAALPDEKKREIEARLRGLQAEFPELRQERVAFPYQTEAWLSERRG
jgi:hypothetical protein